MEPSTFSNRVHNSVPEVNTNLVDSKASLHDENRHIPHHS